MQLLRYVKLVPCLRELCVGIELVWVDGGYPGDDLLNYVRKLWQWTWQVVLRTDNEKGFKLLPRRWVVERTFAWMLNVRRLNAETEQRLRKNRRNSQLMVYLAMISLMLNRL